MTSCVNICFDCRWTEDNIPGEYRRSNQKCSLCFRKYSVLATIKTSTVISHMYQSMIVARRDRELLDRRLKKLEAVLKDIQRGIKDMEYVKTKQEALEDILTPVVCALGSDSYSNMMEQVIQAKKEFASTE